MNVRMAEGRHERLGVPPDVVLMFKRSLVDGESYRSKLKVAALEQDFGVCL